MSPKDKLQYNRPREKLLLRGQSNLTNEELIQIILGSGNRYKNVSKLAAELEELIFAPRPQIRLFDLLQISGISLAKGSKLIAAVEIAERLRMRKERLLDKPEKVLPFLHSIANKTKEYLILLTLNGAKQVLNMHQISVGTMDSTLIHPREIFIEAIKDQAACFIISHNHPGQSVMPSLEDEKVTQMIAKSGKIMGIELLDHIIVNSDLDFYSFRDDGKI